MKKRPEFMGDRVLRPSGVGFGFESDDVVVWGGPAKLAFHGVEPLADGDHPANGTLPDESHLRRAL